MNPHPTLEKILALLAKAESTTFAAEAEALTAKATELMARYSIDAAMLSAAERRGGGATQIAITLHRPYVAQKSILVDAVADAFGCAAVRCTRRDGVEEARIVGFPSDLEMVETLVTSLLVQLAGAMLHGQPQARTSAESAGWRRSFMMGFISSVGTRLAAQRAAVVVDLTDEDAGGSSSVAVVLADQKSEVNAEFKRRFPHVRTTRVSAGSSKHGYVAGGVAGERADLGGQRLGGRASLPA